MAVQIAVAITTKDRRHMPSLEDNERDAIPLKTVQLGQDLLQQLSKLKQLVQY